jgi:hypothetical protein
VNISEIGHRILESNENQHKDKESGGFLDHIDDTKDTILDKVDDTIGDATSLIMDKLGIPEWYSIHIAKFCYGSFNHSTTAALVTTGCSKASSILETTLTSLKLC